MKKHFLLIIMAAATALLLTMSPAFAIADYTNQEMSTKEVTALMIDDQEISSLIASLNTLKERAKQKDVEAKALSTRVNNTTDFKEYKKNIFQTGVASWYGPRFYGRKTASGEIFTKNQLTAAHRTLPFGTKLKVTNQSTGQSVIVRVNDRGPFTGNRVIDLSHAAANRLGMIQTGLCKVTIEKI